MPTQIDMAVKNQPTERTEIRVNDVVIEVATANGTGSQSANMILARSIQQMGVPVGAKNLFPSNIQGLPTWFTVRANARGWTARRREPDIMVCMNKESIVEDTAKLLPGSIVVVRDDLQPLITRADLTIFSVPFAKLVVPVCEIARLRKLVVNIMYVGVLAYLLDIALDEVHQAIDKLFGRKPKAAEMNKNAVDAAHAWARENLKPLERFRIEPMDGTKGKLLIDGNTACALGAVWAGVTVTAWYPITPSSSLAEALIDHMKELRHDPATGKATYAIVQAEDEPASIGIVLGAGWAGARAMTCTSGPGISLMSEQAGLAYFAEIPAVIVDVQRMGPSTGLPTRTCQGDILKAYYLSHGDCKHLLLIPGNIRECFDFTCESFNIAERFQTLVFVMTDLDLGMNIWLSDDFEPTDKPIERGKVLGAADLERLGKFERYRDVDGDGIPYRTLPGVDHPLAAYFNRGTGHAEDASYSEKPDDWTRVIDRIEKKFETARRELPPPVIHLTPGARCGLIAYGSSDPAVEEALSVLAEDHDLPIDYLRVRALPAHADVYEFIKSHERVYVVDQNRDAQMATILKSERPDLGIRLRGVRYYGGEAIDAETIVEQILEQES